MSSSASSRRMAARRPKRSSRGLKSSRAGSSLIRAMRSPKWTSTPFWPVGRASFWSTSLPTPMRRRAGIQSATWMSELLAAGIDVYTTLNIQHVESLNDIVAGITKVRVRETVPDSIIDLACDIELIDLTPEDLIARLNEGKVYVPEQA